MQAAAPVSFSEQFKNEKPGLMASSQASSVLTTEAAEQKKAVTAKSNPFAKKSEPSNPESAQQADVFADLKAGAGGSKLD